MEPLGFDKFFFSEIIEDYGKFDDECVLEFFEENENEESAEIYRKIKKIEGGKPFSKQSMILQALFPDMIWTMIASTMNGKANTLICMIISVRQENRARIL